MRVASRDDLTAWLDGLSKNSILIAPKSVGEQILYKPVADGSEVVLDFAKADLPIKEYFLPATHAMLAIKRDAAGISLDDPSLEDERVIFGVRPCDARGLRVLDALFLEEEPADPYYAERREKTTLIGLACQEMGEECFCTSVGLAPDDASDVDLMLTHMGEGYALQEITDKGESLLSRLVRHEVEGTASKPTVRKGISIPEVEDWPQHFEDAFWARLGDRCLSCRVCTYVCPTCRCFDVRDRETSDGTIERLRAWDSCQAESYRRIAGGHNPRPTKAARLRNRFYCKFCYYPRDYGPIGCVGCGRCITKCPVNVDIVEVLENVASRREGQ